MKATVHAEQPSLFGGLPAELLSPRSGSSSAVAVCEPASDLPVVPAGPGSTLRVVGIDPSLVATGIASSAGWCETVGQAKVSTLPLYERMDVIDRLVREIMDIVGHPDLAVIEHPLFRSGTGAVFDRYTLFYQVCRSLRSREVPTAFVNVQHRMQYATGSGAVKKGAIVDAVARRLPMFDTGGDDNMADAVILCALGADHLGIPLATMPDKNRKVLDAVEWPEVAGGGS